MKTLTQTIIPIVVLSLLAAGVVSANNASDDEIQATKTDIGPILAQDQSSQPATPAPPTVPTPTPTPTPAIPQQTPPTLPAISKNIYNLTGLSYGSRAGSSDMVLVIPTEQTKTEDLIAINEDMNVMARIFEKNLEQDRIVTSRSGIFMSSSRDPFGILLGGSRGQIQSMYLQGFGALFMLKVDFPLSPSPDMEQEQQDTEKQEQGDSVWQQTVQEMYNPEKVNRIRRSEEQQVKYDPEKVENLKTTLIKTLKHARNIRNLKPDESVILTVVGKGESTGVTIAAAKAVPGEDQIIIVEKNADGTKTQKVVQGNSLDVLDDIGLSSPTVLVIRAKKSDIDEFSKGDIDYENFRQRVRLLTYPLLGGADDGSRDLFNPYIQLRSTGSSNRR